MDLAGQRPFSDFRPGSCRGIGGITCANPIISICQSCGKSTVSVTGSDSHWLYVSLQFINVSFSI